MERKYNINGQEFRVDILEKNANYIRFLLNGEQYKINTAADFVEYNGNVFQKSVVKIDKSFKTHILGLGHASINEIKANVNNIKDEDGGPIISPMPGKILKVLVQKGDAVVKGQPLLILEAMKMEHTIKAFCSGKVIEVKFKDGDQVKDGTELILIKV